MHRHSRRDLLKSSLGLVGLGLLSGCERFTQKVSRIGFLAVGSRQGRAFLIDGFLRGLREHGYVEGKNIVIEYRFAEDRNDRLPTLAAELVALKVQAILTSGTPASFAAKRATNTIPIVAAGLAADPVETGLVVSLARPGSNVTGTSLMTAQLGGKRLELLKHSVPGLTRVAVFWNPPNPAYGPVFKELEVAAPRLGLTILRVEVRTPADLEGAFQLATRERAGALIAPGDPLTTDRTKMLADLALKHRLPMMMDIKEFVEAGGLLSLGLNLVYAYQRAAAYVDKILKGAKPADLPMEQPTNFDLFVNLKTAGALGLTIPESILVQATQVIQ
jgi:putative tryptophan/tyrosine transport system substrate-binding protein